MDPSSGTAYAVLVSAMSFHRLEDEVTERWLKELCPGKRLPSDDADRGRKVASCTYALCALRGRRGIFALRKVLLSVALGFAFLAAGF
jgi:hypothetical protein